MLLSGSGRTLANLIDCIAADTLAAEIVAVVSSRPGVRGLDIAESAGLPTRMISRSMYADHATFSDAIYEAVAPFAPDLIILAGFLKRLVVPPQWAGWILNIHPCLIPEANAAGPGFYGERVHAAVIASGATLSGATVHLVDDEYDHGPILLKETVPVLPGDTTQDLAARVFALEREIYPRAISQYVADHPELFMRSDIEPGR